MPLIIAWGLGALAVGAGVKMMGDGIEDGTRAVRDITIVAAVGFGIYVVAKKQRLI